MNSRKLLLLGWDAADWSLLHPLLEAGAMPNLQRLVESGVMGSLATLPPAVSTVLWTSMAVGKPAEDHRILGQHEPDPLSGGARLSSSTSRVGKALWNILHQNGLRTHLVNWPAGHPAEPIRGTNVTYHACAATLEPPAGSIHPEHLAAELAHLRLNPTDLRAADLALYIPAINSIDQDRDTRPIQLARILSEGLTAHAFATWILEHQPWDFLGVYLDVIGRAGFRFMRYHPPRMEGIDETSFDLFQHVMTGVYRTHDLMLGRLLQLAGPEATVMMVSGHGLRGGNLRPEEDNSDPVLWYREHGIFLLSGPGIRKDELVTGAGVLDVAPTVLALFGIPPGADMPGRMLREAFEEDPALQPIPSWDEVEGDAGLPPPYAASVPQAWDTIDALRELEALGYTDTISEDLRKRQAAAAAHQNFNLALGLMARRRFREAIGLLEQLETEAPGVPAVRTLLAQAYMHTQEFERSRQFSSELLKHPSTHASGQILLSTVADLQGQPAVSLTHLTRAEDTAPAADVRTRIQIGYGYLRLRRSGDAERHFRQAIEIDGRSSSAWRGLAAALILQKRFQNAAEAALESVSLDYSNSSGHLVLGIALTFHGSIHRAGRAFETCLSVQPRAVAAHRWLAYLHQRFGTDPAQAQFHRDRIAELEASPEAALTEVSGSGG